jgi:hypothetical protein
MQWLARCICRRNECQEHFENRDITWCLPFGQEMEPKRLGLFDRPLGTVHPEWI